MLLNCGVGKDSWESLGLQGDQSWVFIGRTDAEAEAPILWPPHVKSWLIGKDWCWEGLGAGGEVDNRGWDGWMASPTWWAWVLSKILELVMDREAWRAAVHRVPKSRTRLSNWTELNWIRDSTPWRRRSCAGASVHILSLIYWQTCTSQDFLFQSLNTKSS